MVDETRAQAVIEAGRACLWTYREGESRTSMRARLGLDVLESGYAGGHRWLPWLLHRGGDPLDCGDVRAHVYLWGEHLNQLAQSGAMAESSLRNLWFAVRGWHRWLRVHRGWDCDVYWGREEWPWLQPERARDIRTLSVEETHQLLDGSGRVDGNALSRARARALVSVLVATGCRIGEAAHLLRMNVRMPVAGEGGEALLKGKGRKRTVDLPGWACDALRDYWAVRDRDGVPTVPEYAFTTNRRRGGRWTPVQAATLAGDVSAAARAAGMVHVFPHLIRHTMITSLLDSGESPYDVMAFSGHSSVSAVEHYDHRRRGVEVGRRWHAALAGANHREVSA